MKRIIAAGRVDGGKLHLNARKTFEEQLREIEGQVVLTVQRSTRSLRQNDLLWVYNTLVGRELGWDPEEVHEFTKSKINLVHKTRLDKSTGELVDESFPGGTHDMAKDEFSDYLERYVSYWAVGGIVLQSPEEFLAGQP